MSETVNKTGTIKRIKLPEGLSPGDQHRALRERGFHFFEYSDGQLEADDPKLQYFQGQWWEVDAEEGDAGYNYEMHPTEDPDVFRFNCTWYNGSQGLGEVLERAYEEMSPNKKPQELPQGVRNFIRRPYRVQAIQWTGKNAPEIAEFSKCYDYRVADSGNLLFLSWNRVDPSISLNLGRWLLRDQYGSFDVQRDEDFRKTYLEETNEGRDAEPA